VGLLTIDVYSKDQWSSGNQRNRIVFSKLCSLAVYRKVLYGLGGLDTNDGQIGSAVGKLDGGLRSFYLRFIDLLMNVRDRPAREIGFLVQDALKDRYSVVECCYAVRDGLAVRP
jgi:hypothetical protein